MPSLRSACRARSPYSSTRRLATSRALLIELVNGILRPQTSRWRTSGPPGISISTRDACSVVLATAIASFSTALSLVVGLGGEEHGQRRACCGDTRALDAVLVRLLPAIAHGGGCTTSHQSIGIGLDFSPLGP